MFAKVFEQIFDSSIAEDYQVRLVFEDMLTLADIDGVVDKTPEALSRRTNVPIDIIKKAIAVLESPDPISRRSEAEGRRLIRLDDHRDWGWLIVNYKYYRELASEEQRRAKTRERVNKYRDKIRCNAGVTLGNDSPSSSSSTSSFVSSEGGSGGKDEPQEDKDFAFFWEVYPRKIGKGAARKAWLKNKCGARFDKIMETLQKFTACDQWKKDGGQFIPHPATWLNQERWDDEPTTDTAGTKSKWTNQDSKFTPPEKLLI